EMQGKITRFLEMIFARQAGIEAERAGETEVLEIRVTPDQVSIVPGPGDFPASQGGVGVSFYVEPHPEEM
ncbi:MAG TPA: hypothetical protein VLH40_02730, partial [Atribacteraceae bacterium]|nr:hypothetical protein [Atribacteraceae bacterium]